MLGILFNFVSVQVPMFLGNVILSMLTHDYVELYQLGFVL